MSEPDNEGHTCIDCSFWSMWDWRCKFPGKGFPKRDGEAPACVDFELNEAEMELRRKEGRKA